MNKKIVAVADIHGDYDKLLKLMSEFHSRGINAQRDTFVFLGDYVDGGTQTRNVVTYLMQLHDIYPHWHFLMGNHEDMMLSGLGYYRSICHPYYPANNFYMWFNQGGKETIESYRPHVQATEYEKSIMQPLNIIPKKHLQWLQSLELYYETDDFIFVHAGLLSGKTPKESVPAELLWCRGEFYNSTHDWGKYVIAGHTYHEEPLVKKNLMVIDTMHHGHGSLTAVILDEKKYRQDRDAMNWFEFIRVS